MMDLSSMEMLFTPNLTMVPGSYYEPKVSRSMPDGQDAHFFNTKAQVIAVADGVGGWSKNGIDSGIYSRALIKNIAMSKAVREYKLLGSVDPMAALREAFLKTLGKGTTTCCVVALDDDILHAVNLGDSGFMVLRGGKVFYKSPTQQCGFNCPYQMGRGKFCRQGPKQADEVAVAVEDGDVVIVATDGLFDNAFDEDIEKVVSNPWLAKHQSPGYLAQMLVFMAVNNSLNKEKESPFQKAACMAGKKYCGGKYDDVTVVAAYVKSV